MADPGWYPDPDEPGLLRWWDGQQWTEHRHAVAPEPVGGDVVVRVRTGDDERSELVATTDRLTIGGEVFALAEIDTVQWTAVRSHLNGAYMGTSFNLRVRAGDRKRDFGMSTNHKNVRLDEFSDAYSRIVGLLDAVVCPRLADDLAARLRSGETITIGPAGARVELTSAGFRPKKPLSKVVAWDRVAGTELDGGRVYVLVRKGDGEAKRHSMVPFEGENIVLLPHLVRRLAPAPA